MSHPTGKSLEDLFKDLTDVDIQGSKLPPVERWDPPLSGDIDIRIDREGRWYHEGDAIEREALVRLFSQILKREGEHHYLVTPVEKWRISVDIAPFYVKELEVVTRENQQALVFVTSTGERVVAGAEHPLRVITDPLSAEPVPLLAIRGGMDGLLSRPVFYQLVDLAEPGPDEKKAEMGVYSLGEFFALE